MSDSEEDFASADEGEPSPTEVKPQETPPVVEKNDKELQESKTSEKSKTGKTEKSETGTREKSQTAGKSDSPAVDSKPKQGKKKGRGSEKDKAGPLGTESEKGGKKSTPKSGAQDKVSEEKVKQKPHSGKGKKGKGNEKGASAGKIPGENTDKKKDNLAKKNETEKNKETDKTSTTESGKAEMSEESKVKEDKTEKFQELTPGGSVSENVSQLESIVDLKSKSEKDVEISSGSQDNLTVEQQASLIKSPSSQSITRPEPDHTDKQEAVLEKLAGAAKEKKSGWGWGWGSSLLEVASTSVSTFTSQVGEGLHTMMETVESTLNVPDPEELAQKVAKQTEDSTTEDAENNDGEPEETSASDGKDGSNSENQSMKSEEAVKQTEEAETTETQSSKDKKKPEDQSADGDGWFSAWGVSNITKMVESTGKNIVTGGLDVLETLGKKTFDVINEHDPGLKKARAFLHDRGDKPNLSAVLRDAKSEYETQMQQEKETEEARKAHFGSLFDDFQGLAHLEALEMLSNQSEKKVNVLLNALPAEAISKLKPELLEIKQNFEITEDEEDVTEQEFALLVTDLLKELDVGTTPAKLLKTHDSVEEKLAECCDTETQSDVKEIHRVAISSLAELTSKCIEQFHKAGELILIQKASVSNFCKCSNTLLRLTKVLTEEVGILSTKFSDCLNKHEGDEIKVSHLVTNIYLEASNSSSYIQDGFQLLLPVLQQAAIERSQELEPEG